MLAPLSDEKLPFFRIDRIMKTKEYEKLRKNLPAVKKIEEKNRKMKSAINKHKVEVKSE